VFSGVLFHLLLVDVFGVFFFFFFCSFCFGVTCEVPGKCFSSFWRFSFIVRMLRPVGFDSGGFLLDVCFCCFFYLFCLVLFCCLFVFLVWRYEDGSIVLSI
jgi:hypothetical protein